jgi:malonyl CoA-acyl carrier protein transacylase/acyl carrier protein/SAM-dependent methyltransferase
MPVGSVKGLIGHTECTSGVVALIKVLLLIHYGIIPPQASFQTLSPALKATADDMLEVCTKQTPWNVEYRAALINNYGASGSNASMIVTQPPKLRGHGPFSPPTDGGKYAFWLTGLDERSLRDYALRLSSFLASKKNSSLSGLSFNAYRQSNRALPHGLIFSSSSMEELQTQLTDFAKGNGKLSATTRKPVRPVILCFGGQISRFVGLDKAVYESIGTLRTHLDRCDATLQSLGLDGLYPGIFERSQVDDPVKLQTMLFALQYSCAKCWLDCGLQPVAVVGHSFGELTALCIAGVLTLRDSLQVVAMRAQLIKSSWGPDPGAMMAVEGNLADVQMLLNNAERACPEETPATVACFNGPTTFTLAGSIKAIDAVGECISSVPGVRGKKLSVSNAFHSTLVEPLKDQLGKLAEGMIFGEAKIRWERATENQTSANIGPVFFASHMRDPVYANHAFQRLHREFPSAIWLEAGSNSTITRMANKALGFPAESHFVDINITSDSALNMLTESFVNLWKEGLAIPHWAHHCTQAQAYSTLLLPPYQFEKSRHWLELKKPQAVQQIELSSKAQQEELPTKLYTFVGYQDEGKRQARFRVNTMIKAYGEFVSGHLIVQTAAICPATLEVDITIEALFTLCPDFKATGLQPQVANVENLVPICVDPSRVLWLDLRATTSDFKSWEWQMVSTNEKGESKSTHVKGQIIFQSAAEAQAEFSRYERLVPHRRCTEILYDSDPDDVLQGRNMYKVFAEIVDYSEPYRGLRKLVGKGTTSAGRVVKQRSGETWLDTHISDCFSQVGGFWVNCMTDRSASDMYIAAGFESWIRRPGSTAAQDDSEKTSVWDVMACHVKASEKAYTTDIFIFDATSGLLSEIILGINYSRLPRSTMSKMLTKLTAPSERRAQVDLPSMPASINAPPSASEQGPVEPAPRTKESAPIAEHGAGGQSNSKVPGIVVEVLAELSGVEPDAIKMSTKLADIGIDSLVGMEMVHDLESKCECSLDMDEMAEVVTVNDVVQCVHKTLGIEGGSAAQESDGNLTPASSGTQSPRSDPVSDTSLSDLEQLPRKESDPELQLSASDVLGAFGETKKLTDQFITDFNCAGYMDNINPKQTQLCIALTIEAFEKLGCNLRTAKAGEALPRISHAPQHGRLTQYLYNMLEHEGRLIDIDGDTIVRTAVSVPHKSSKEILASLEGAYPEHVCANRLAFFCGTRLVEVLEGKLDGVKLIFGNEEGRQLVAGLYGDTQLNIIFYKQMEDILTRLTSRIPRDSGRLRILEMGAGTGGTTKYLVPLLAKLGAPVEYTFTDLAPSFVAAARRQYKAYPFMKFRAHDIEQEPAQDLIGTQHIIIASNAVHATHSLTVSAKNMRKALRPDGFLMMLEMTQTVPWVDIIFGLLEGWWLFDDGRQHAISPESRWEKDLQSVGYGHIDWTDGHLAENKLQRIIIAMASGPQYDRLPIGPI